MTAVHEHRHREAPGVEILDTTEVRWFIDGALPAEVATWFASSATVGYRETRRDTYLADGRRERGVKWRFQKTPELKERQGPAGVLTFAPGLEGWMETWRRWSPAHDRLPASLPGSWIDTHKSIIKRRFTESGTETEMTRETRPRTGSGCEVEVAAIAVDDREFWTFAFAAFGPSAQHRRSLANSWLTLNSSARCPVVALETAQSSGYPEWISGLHPRPSATG